MRWTTTDPRSSGFADKIGATVNYVTGGAMVTLQKTGSGSTDWSQVDAVLPASPMDASRCPIVTTDPRSGGRAGAVDEVVLYTTGGEGTYLIKYGTTDTDWVPLPVAFNPGVGNEGDLLTTVSGEAVWQAPSGGSSWDAIFSGGQDGSINFNGGAVSVATGPVANVYTLTQNVAATDLSIAATYEVKTAGYAVFVRGTFSGSGKLTANGNAGTSIIAGGTAGTGGTGATGATLPAGANGGAGAINASSSADVGAGATDAPLWNPVGAGGAGGATTPGAGTAGSAGGTCKGGGSGGRGGGGFSVGAQAGKAGGSVGSINPDSAFTQSMISGRRLGGNTFGPSTGGAGAASPDTYNDVPGGIFNTDGAGGGGSGGWLVLCARECTFTGTLEAKGGAGGNGYSFVCGGGSGGIGGPGAGGGAGGTIICIIGGGSFPTFDVSGGAGGTGGSCTGGSVNNYTAPNGGAGGSGYVIQMDLSS